MTHTILTGHISPMTAYNVDDYPYGFRLRCKVRYWLECSLTHGVRMMMQTSNPKRGHVWNKAKAGTYSRFGAALYLDDAGHVHCAGMHEYMDGAACVAFRDAYSAGVPDAAREMMHRWVAAKLAYDAARTKADPLSVGLPEARAAFCAPVVSASQQDEDAMNDFNYVGSRHHY